MKKSKRILALLMCILMCVSLLPVSAFAEDGSADFAAAEEAETAPADEAPAAEEISEEPAVEPAEQPAAEEQEIPALAEETADEAEEAPEIALAGEDDIIASGTCTGDNVSWTLTEGGLLTISGDGIMHNVPWPDYMEQIKSVVIKEGVTSICPSAFRDATNLTSVSLPKGLLTIGKQAFIDCTALRTITIPASVTTIGENAFKGVGAVEVDAKNAKYASVDGALFNKAKTQLIYLPTCTTGTYIVPDGVTEIADWAAYDCTGLKNIQFPITLDRIGSYAFFGCSSLSVMAFIGSGPSIYNNAFYNAAGGNGILAYYAYWNDGIYHWDDVIEDSYGTKITWIADTSITVDETTFPDMAFRKAVKALFGETMVKISEFAMVNELDVAGLGIADLTGIDNFTQLETLTCNNNKMTEAPKALSNIGKVNFNYQLMDAALTLYQVDDYYLADFSEVFPQQGIAGIDDDQIITQLTSDIFVIDYSPAYRDYVVVNLYSDVLKQIKVQVPVQVVALEVTTPNQTLLLAPGDSADFEISCNLANLVNCQVLSFYVTSSYPVDESQPEVAIVDGGTDSGTVAAVCPGTAYVTAYINIDGRIIPVNNEFLRVDVAESGRLVKGVQLVDTKASLNLALTAGAEIEILPLLDQLQLMDEGENLIQSAALAYNSKTTQIDNRFDVEVVDSRTLRITPNELAMEEGTIKAGTYKFKVLFKVEGKGEAVVADQILTLTVTNKEPTVKATAIKLNSFWGNPTAALSFTGLDVCGVQIVSKPDWLNVDLGSMTVSLADDKAPAKASGKLVVRCLSNDLRNGVTLSKVTVNVSVARTEPKVLLGQKSITFTAKQQSSAQFDFTITSSEFYNAAVRVERFTEKVKGKNVECDDSLFKAYVSSYTTGTYTAHVSYYAADEAAHSYTMWFSVGGKEFSIPVNVTALSKASFTLKTTGAIDTSFADSCITLQATVKNYPSYDYTVTIAGVNGYQKGAGGKFVQKVSYAIDDEACPFTFEKIGWDYVIKQKSGATLPNGMTWYVNAYVSYDTDYSTGEHQKQTQAKLIKLTINNPTKPTQAVAQIKASGKIDLYGQTSGTFTVSLKNVTADVEPTGYVLTRVYNGTTRRKDNTVMNESGCFSVSKPGNTYYVHIWKTSGTYTNEDGTTKTIYLSAGDKFTFTPVYDAAYNIKVTPVSFTLTKSKLSVSTVKTTSLLKKDCYSTATLPLTVKSGHTIADVTLDAKSAAVYNVTLNNDNTVTLSYKDHKLPLKAVTSVTLNVFAYGNNTCDYGLKAVPDATLAVKVTLK